MSIIKCEIPLTSPPLKRSAIYVNQRKKPSIASPHRSLHREPFLAPEDIQKESIFDQLKEALGNTGNDTGHWNYSVEWYGKQGGSWGRSEGQTIFSKQSEFNGLVEVTAHEASLKGFSSFSTSTTRNLRQEWRVLRFNKVTRQSVSRVSISSPYDDSNLYQSELNGTADNIIDTTTNTGREVDTQTTLATPPDEQQQRVWLENMEHIETFSHPECLAQEYLKSIASVIAALIGVHTLLPHSSSPRTPLSPPVSETETSSVGAPEPCLRILCIGMGGGSLPSFLSHHYPFCMVDVVEIDPVVYEAATLAMGLVSNHPRMKIYIEDAIDFIDRHVEQVKEPYDIICMDAFDGNDTVPQALMEEKFACKMAKALHAKHGSLVMNLHSIDVRIPSKVYRNAMEMSGEKVGDITLDNTDKDSGTHAADEKKNVSCFAVSTNKQQNVTLVCSRGLDSILPRNEMAAKDVLKNVSAYVAGRFGFNFPAGSRASRNFLWM